MEKRTKIEDLFRHTFRGIYNRTGMRFMVNNGKLEDMFMSVWGFYLSQDNSLCQSIIKRGLLTPEQMAHAAMRYRLGKTIDDGVVLWHIDEHERVRDGRVVWFDENGKPDDRRKPTWMSSLLLDMFDVNPTLLASNRCLMGMHLLSNGNLMDPCHGEEKIPMVMIVENELRAIVLSELKPVYIWLAVPDGMKLTMDMLKSMPKRVSIVLYIDPGENGAALAEWNATVNRLMTDLEWGKQRQIMIRELPKEYCF